MLKVIKVLYDRYNYAFTELQDPRMTSYPLLGHGGVTIAMIILFYLKFVLHWGPEFMKNRKPFQIDKILILYNTFQIVASFYVFQTTFRYAYLHGGYSTMCQPIDTSNSATALALIAAGYRYFLLKIIDLLDTLFFILRKKSDQLTFLHIYHHTGMIILVWIGAKFVPGGSSMLIVCINSFVHTVMYSYYLIALITKNKEILWWKKYITQLQLLQFLIISITSLYVLMGPYCGYPKWIGGTLFLQNFCMLTLFGDFYYKSYIKKTSNNKTNSVIKAN